jgi:hypothetical protein
VGCKNLDTRGALCHGLLVAHKKKCPGCERMVRDLEGVTVFEHGSVEFVVCSDCTTLLCGCNPGYPWREKLLSRLEKYAKLRRSQRIKVDPDDLGDDEN